MHRPEIIFFGNGTLADFTKATLSPHFSIIFHARSASDLAEIPALKRSHPQAFGILASFGVLIKLDILQLFEPFGIINLHPSLLPQYRGASPIETAILNGDKEFGVSIMKLVPAMDAGPIYYQTYLSAGYHVSKLQIYQDLATLGANWLVQNLSHLPTPTPQNDNLATFTTKLSKSLSPLDQQKTALALHNQVRAFQIFPKSTIKIKDLDCIILQTHVGKQSDDPTLQPVQAQPRLLFSKTSLALVCKDANLLFIDQIQPAGKKPMSASAFINGYLKK